MIDISKQIVHWQKGAEEALEVAQDLIDRDGRILFGLFFAHLALEKLLKALVCKQTNRLAPRTHNLLVLANLVSLALPPKHRAALTEMNTFNIRGRYPDLGIEAPPLKQAKAYLKQAQEAYIWLKKQL